MRFTHTQAQNNAYRRCSIAVRSITIGGELIQFVAALAEPSYGHMMRLGGVVVIPRGASV
jgi:hypothetical protein